MSRDPFEEARRAMARAHMRFEQSFSQAAEELRAAMEDVRRQIEAEMRRRPGGRGQGPSWSGRDWRPRGPFPKGPGGPMPMPVKPDRPSPLSGGAEVPLED